MGTTRIHDGLTMEQPFGEDKKLPPTPAVYVPFNSRMLAHLNGVNFKLPNVLLNVVPFTTTQFDGLGEFNGVTYRFVPLNTGYYLIQAQVQLIFDVPINQTMIAFRDWGAIFLWNQWQINNNTLYAAMQATTIRRLLVGQWVEVLIQANPINPINPEVMGSLAYSHFTVHRLS